MHNTLVVDGRSQSTVKGPFSWSTTAQGRVRQWKTHEAFDYFEGTHDGYHPIEHRRHVLTLPGDLLVVADLVAGEGTHAALAHWHVDPRWRVSVRESTVTFATGSAQCQLAVPRGHIERFDADPQTGLGWRAPVYGAMEPSTSLRVTHNGPLPFWMVSVFGLHRDNAVVDVEFMPVSTAAGVLKHSVALRIARRQSIDVVGIAEASTAKEWRFGGFDTDARVLFCREQDARIGPVLMLDGSRVRDARDGAIEIEVPHLLPQIYLAGIQAGACGTVNERT
jgi:hypothetical protein